MPDRHPGADADGIGPAMSGDVVTISLAASPVSIGVARSQVHAICVRNGLTALSDTAALLVSELVTNAIMHAGSDVTLSIACTDCDLTVSATDASPAPPHLDPDPPIDQAGGRGLFLIDTLATNWNYAVHPGGKTVWFCLSRSDTVSRR